MPYTIRAGRADEAERLRAIEWAAQQSFAEVGYPELALGEPVAAEVLQQAAAIGLLLVAADARDEAAGFAICEEIDGSLYVRELDVHPEHARQRLGARLLDAASELAQRRRLPALTLTTFRSVPWNAPYYARLGFAEMREDEIGPGMALVLARQRAAGLDMDNRVAMRRDLA